MTSSASAEHRLPLHHF